MSLAIASDLQGYPSLDEDSGRKKQILQVQPDYDSGVYCDEFCINILPSEDNQLGI